MTELYFDGSSHPHNTELPASYGFVIKSSIHISETELVPVEFGNTNNVAEYYALIKGLEKAISLGISDVKIIGDSQLVIYQVMGKYQCRKPHLKPLLEKVHDLLALIPKYQLEWKRRDKNIADAVSRKS